LICTARVRDEESEPALKRRRQTHGCANRLDDIVEDVPCAHRDAAG